MSDLIDKTLYKYLESAIIHNLDYDFKNYAILSVDQESLEYRLYFELEEDDYFNPIFTGYCYLVNDNEFKALFKELKKQGLELTVENTKNLTRHKLDFKITANEIMTSLYNMTGL
jgi:hypothetical protein